jgi:hypothetical protein
MTRNRLITTTILGASLFLGGCAASNKNQVKLDSWRAVQDAVAHHEQVMEFDPDFCQMFAPKNLVVFVCGPAAMEKARKAMGYPEGTSGFYLKTETLIYLWVPGDANWISQHVLGHELGHVLGYDVDHLERVLGEN